MPSPNPPAPAQPNPPLPLTPAEAAAKDVRDWAVNFAAFRNRPALLFRTDFISHLTAMRVQQVLAGRTFQGLDVIIESPGGSPNSAFVIANLIRGHAANPVGIVPGWAKSAATLIGLALDELVLHELGEMGPLDTQVEVRSAHARPKSQSALEVVKAVRETQKSALQLWQLAARLLINSEGLNVHGAYDLAGRFVGHVAGSHMSPIQLDQYGESVRYLEITKNYARSLLTRFRGFSEQRATDVATRLVENYASHNYVIDVDDLREIGLTARLADAREEILLSMARVFLTNDDLPETIEIIDVPAPSKAPPAPPASEVNGTLELKTSPAAVDSTPITNSTNGRQRRSKAAPHESH